MIGKVALSSSAAKRVLTPRAIVTGTNHCVRLNNLNDRRFVNAATAASHNTYGFFDTSSGPLDFLRGDVQVVTLPEQSAIGQSSCHSDLAGVVVSWPANQHEGSKNPFRSSMTDGVMTSKPFFMLDGKGRRLGSLCLLKKEQTSSKADTTASSDARSQLLSVLQSDDAAHVDDILRLEDCLPFASKSELQMKGIWLQEYRRSREQAGQLRTNERTNDRSHHYKLTHQQ